MLYGLAAFWGAFLLLFIQPYLGKLLTPHFGGTSQVWMTCMLFFQVALLGGYAYAHWLVSKCSLKAQRYIHAAVLCVAASILFHQGKLGQAPLDYALTVPTDDNEMVLSILRYLSLRAGLPMVALAATSPLLQSWYSKKSPEGSPYRLYAASNLGSLLGLVAYPFLAERHLSLCTQGWWFACAFLLGLFVPLLAPRFSVWKRKSILGTHTSVKEFIAWAFCAAIGNSLFMAISTHVASEVAAIPLLWVAPLALYLGTFILIFEYSVASYQRTLLVFASVCLAITYSQMLWPYETSPTWQMGAAFGTVFFGALLCHGFLYALRPPVERLTTFYLALAVGGVLGGGFVALGAPLLYDRLAELPAVVLLAGVAGILWVFSFPKGWLRALVLLPSVVVAMGAWGLWDLVNQPGVWLRDEYGTLHVVQTGRVRELYHGKALHGAMHVDKLSEPLVHYAHDSGAALALVSARRAKPALQVGMMGLGVGSLSTYMGSGDTLVVYEISPAVLFIAGEEGRAFPLLKICAATTEVVRGDARVSLAREIQTQGSRHFDVLFLDTFSSDAVPWHLLTVDALALYVKHLSPEGLLVVNVSSALPLDKIVSAGAKHLGLYGLLIAKPAPSVVAEEEMQPFLRESSYLVIAKSKKALEDPALLVHAQMGFGPSAFSRPVPTLPSAKHVWTDQRSSLSDLVFTRRAFHWQ